MLQSTQKSKIFSAQEFFQNFLGIKEIINTKEEIDLISKNIEENNKIISELKIQLQELSKELAEIKTNCIFQCS